MESECEKSIGITDLNLDLNKWDPNQSVESFYYFEEKIFDAWEKNENCINNDLMNVIYVCNMSVQIDNGGIISFVDNGSGDYFNQTLQALKEMEIEKHYNILKEFQGLFPDENVPGDMDERRDLMDVVLERTGDSEEPFETWDNTIYSSREYFLNKIIDYLKKHAHNIN